MPFFKTEKKQGATIIESSACLCKMENAGFDSTALSKTPKEWHPQKTFRPSHYKLVHSFKNVRQHSYFRLFR